MYVFMKRYSIRNIVLMTIGASLLSLFYGSHLSAFEVVDGTLFLGRPTDSSITINVVPDVFDISPAESIELYFEYGKQETSLSLYSATFQMTVDPVVVTLSDLDPNSRYYYKMRYRPLSENSSELFDASDTYSFQTQRSKGESFVFTIQADSHLGNGVEGSDDILYKNTLNLVRKDQPDFHIDLGDTFMITRGYNVHAGWYDAIEKTQEQYLKHRPFFGIVSHSSPTFLVIGNHENEEGWNLDDVDDITQSYPILSQNGRKRYYANPTPNGFYSGVTETLDAIHGDQKRDTIYAFTWGDALFVVLDPYFYTMEQPYSAGYGQENGDEIISDDPWSWTLGINQYKWLKEVLSAGDAKFKFVFAHQVTGGSIATEGDGTTSGYGRGGGKVAHLFEWGGQNPDGSWGFNDNRSLQDGWDTPIHQLMVENDVDIFFHGHDHLYSKEVVDGLVYQECPRPNSQVIDNDYGLAMLDYDIDSDDTDTNSGYLRVTVTSTKATVEYVRSQMDDTPAEGVVSHQYTILATHPNTPPTSSTINFSIDSNTTQNFTLTAIDKDDDELSFSILNGPFNGTLDNNGSSYVYTPNSGFIGQDWIVYQAEDIQTKGNVSYIYFNVSPTNDLNNLPTLLPATFHTPEDVPIVIEPEISEGWYDSLELDIVVSAEHGSTTVIGERILYEPEADYFGIDHFSCVLSDSVSQSYPVEFNVIVEEVDDPPIAVSQTLKTDEDLPIDIYLLADDPDNDQIFYTILEQPKHGVLEGSGDKWTYYPESDYSGSDSFLYFAKSGAATSNTASVNIEIYPVHDLPVANDIFVKVETNNKIVIDLSVDNENESRQLTYLLVSQPNGSLWGDNTTYTYTPIKDALGIDSFIYRITDELGNRSEALVTIEIVPASNSINDAVSDAGIDTTGFADSEFYNTTDSAIEAIDSDHSDAGDSSEEGQNDDSTTEKDDSLSSDSERESDDKSIELDVSSSKECGCNTISANSNKMFLFLYVSVL